MNIPPSVTNMVGKKFGRLTVQSVVGSLVLPSGQKQYMVQSECDCGKTHVSRAIHVLYGRAKSCGCLISETTRKRLTKHGFAPLSGKRKSVYHIWKGIHQRCSNPNSEFFSYYGGRGIKVCDRWSGENGFLNFLADMGEPGRGMSIERKDNNKGYEPDNCKWIPRAKQASNQRSNWKVELGGEIITAREASRRTGHHHSFLGQRLTVAKCDKSKVYTVESILALQPWKVAA